ncbi:hypothetical protein [Salinimicrobium sp. GXAS 041]|uniref:hypothetical protein n=1 Tax=Salinimicrobium sp. GXAS 041 TaxID=3400806 RepID=UPI003C793191
MKNSNENFQARIRKNTVNLAKWTAAWVITMAIVSFGAKLIWDFNPVISGVAIAVNFAIGIGMILANRRHLKAQDEMQRKIQLEAMGISLGIAVVAGLAYSMMDIANLIHYDAEISHLVVLIALTYLAGVIYGSYRYK